MTELAGKHYVARVRLSDRDDRTLAVPGETCEHVSPASLDWLLAQALIEPVAAPQVPPAAPIAPPAEEE